MSVKWKHTEEYTNDWKFSEIVFSPDIVVTKIAKTPINPFKKTLQVDRVMKISFAPAPEVKQ